MERILAENIKRLCKEQGKQLKDLAASMGIDPASLNRAMYGNARLDPVGTDGAQDFGRTLPARLVMEGEVVRARFDEVVDLVLRLHHHQVHVQGEGGVLFEGRHHVRPEGDLRHERAVHHVAVNEIGAAALQLFHRRAHRRKVCR